MRAPMDVMRHDSPSAHPGVVVAATTAVLTAAAMTAFTLAAIAPQVARAIGVPSAAIGYQVTLVYCGGLLTSMFGGALTARDGPCRTSQRALVLIGLGATAALLPDPYAILAGSLVIGFGYGLTNPAASQVLARFTDPGRRNLIFSLKQTGVPLGAMLAGLVGPALALGFGWRAALGTMAAACFALALLLHPLRGAWDAERDPHHPVRRDPLAGVRLVWSMPALRWLALASLCFGAVQLCVTAYTVTLLVDTAGYHLVAAGVVMSLVQLSGTGGRLLWGWVADRLRNGPAVLLLVTTITLAGCLLATRLSPAWPHLAVAALLCMLGFSAIGWNGVYLAELTRRSPPQRVAAATGGALVCTYSGMLLGPSAFALLYGLDHDYAKSFYLLAIIAAAGWSALWQARRAAPAAHG